jgi:hypothetical protein
LASALSCLSKATSRNQAEEHGTQETTIVKEQKEVLDFGYPFRFFISRRQRAALNPSFNANNPIQDISMVGYIRRARAGSCIQEGAPAGVSGKALAHFAEISILTAGRSLLGSSVHGLSFSDHLKTRSQRHPGVSRGQELLEKSGFRLSYENSKYMPPIQ